MNKIKNSVNFLLLLIMVVFLSTGCYRMPSDDECSVIPSTNNSDIIGNNRESANWVPGSGF